MLYIYMKRHVGRIRAEVYQLNLICNPPEPYHHHHHHQQQQHQRNIYNKFDFACNVYYDGII